MGWGVKLAIHISPIQRQAVVVMKGIRTESRFSRIGRNMPEQKSVRTELVETFRASMPERFTGRAEIWPLG